MAARRLERAWSLRAFDPRLRGPSSSKLRRGAAEASRAALWRAEARSLRSNVLRILVSATDRANRPRAADFEAALERFEGVTQAGAARLVWRICLERNASAGFAVVIIELRLRWRRGFASTVCMAQTPGAPIPRSYSSSACRRCLLADAGRPAMSSRCSMSRISSRASWSCKNWACASASVFLSGCTMRLADRYKDWI